MTDLVITEDESKVEGVVAFDTHKGQTHAIHARNVLLATGGAGRQSKKFELAAAASSKHKHHTADEDAAGEVESVLEDGTVVVSQMINARPKTK